MQLDQILAGVGLLLGATVLYALGSIVYRLYFHPLAKFPGPKLLAASEVFCAFDNDIRGLFPKNVLGLHLKYGDVVRIGPDHLSVDGVLGWSEVYGHANKIRSEFLRDKEFFEFEGPGSNVSIFPADRENHRRHRKLLAHAFSDTAMYEQEPLIKQYVDLLIVRLRERAVQQEPLDLVRWFNYTTFDIIGDLAFAEPFHCLDTSNYHPWVEMIFAGIRAGSRARFMMRFPPLRALLRMMITKEDERKRNESRRLTHEKTERRLALGPAPGGRKDFMSYILRHNDEKGMSHKEILHNSESLIAAGSETTATALSGLSYYLGTNPRAMQRLKDEIRTTFNNEDEITMRATVAARLPYTHACIEEGLRIYSPVGESPPRKSPGQTIGGEYVPEGTTVTIFQWATYHNPRNFAKPNDFCPERWLAPSHPYHDPFFDNDRKSAFQAFSYGPRNCIGKNLAYAEMRLILTRFIWNFDFELTPESANWPKDHRIFIVWEKTPLMATLKAVEKT